MSATHPARPDANLTLAKAMGSKRGYDPMPPDQHEWQRTEGEPPLYRMWSWMCGHTIRLGHRSPFAVLNGKPRTLAHAAQDLGMDKGQVSRVWKDGEDRGLWHREGTRLLYLNGDVSVDDVLKAHRAKKVDCTVNLSRIEQLKIKHLPEEERNAFYALWEPAQDFRRDLAAAAIAQARETCDEMDDSILRRVGIERKRHEKATRPPVPVPQMLFEFVQSTALNVTVQPTSVDRTDGEESGENVTAQSAHIRNSEKPSENYSPPPASVPTENRSVGQSSEHSDRLTDPVPFPTDLKPEDARIDGVYALLTTQLAELHEEPSRTLCLQIGESLKGAPLEHLTALIHRKRKKISSMGLCRDLAQEVGRAWLREADARQRVADAREAHDAHLAEQVALAEQEQRSPENVERQRKREESEAAARERERVAKERSMREVADRARADEEKWARACLDALAKNPKSKIWSPEDAERAREILGERSKKAAS